MSTEWKGLIVKMHTAYGAFHHCQSLIQNKSDCPFKKKNFRMRTPALINQLYENST